MHLNHKAKFLKIKKNENKRLTEVVPVTGRRGRSTAVRTGTTQKYINNKLVWAQITHINK